MLREKAGSEPILSVRDLNVHFQTPDEEVHAVRGISLDLSAGETVAIVGESGSGKSQAMLSLMGLLARNGRADGSAQYRGQELIGMSPRQLDTIRGARISMIFQEPMTSLDPLYRIGRQIAEPLMYHSDIAKKDRHTRVVELLRLVGIPDPERRIESYPHELSGGQRQRVMIAMALANNPDILIADEPTTALDVTVQAQILDLLVELQEKLGMGIVFITHDLGIVRRIADSVYVMKEGRVVETGATRSVFDKPQDAYTKMLLNAEPSGEKPGVPQDHPIVLDARDLAVTFAKRTGFLFGGWHVIKALDHVGLSLRKGQTIGVVGESGSGKSTLGRAILRLLPAAGSIRFEERDIGTWDAKRMRPLRRHMQLVFQDPFGSLSPRMTVGEIVSEGLLVHEPSISAEDRDRRAAGALEDVGLEASSRRRFPHEFSGGQRQRIAIARAMILKPKLVVLDEPTSALDRSVQKQVVDLLRDLQDRHDLTYVFISHDLAVVRAMSDEIMVMRDGRVVESGATQDVFENPRADYTRELIAAAFDHS